MLPNNFRPSYRPHNSGHDYYGEGVYLVTLVIRGRDKLLSTLNQDVGNPQSVLSPLGKEVMRCCNYIPEIQAKKGRKIKIHAAICMPDHFHCVLEVIERMDVSVGEVICGFKTGCTQAYRRLHGSSLPYTATDASELQNSLTQFEHPNLLSPSEPYMAQNLDPHRMSRAQRRQYYASLPRNQRPLFDDDYDDTICFPRHINLDEHNRHKAAMINYVHDNPRRAITMKLFPRFFERRLHIAIKGTDKSGSPITRDYAAFGNIYLLRWARKVQVMCHRKARYGMLTDEEKAARGISYQALPEALTSIPYEETQAFQRQHDEVIEKVMAGATVVVTPGISAGEKAIKNKCLQKGMPLIHLQKEPIGALWKPERERFEACLNGSLLILAPWHPDELGEVNGVPQDTSYSVFHNLNELAEEVCMWSGEAVVKRDISMRC